MGAFVYVLRQLVFPSSVVVLAGIVIAGALFYFVLLFRLERDLRREVSELVEHLGLPWPSFL
jgi:uncharacterized integral membrane protein